MKKILLILIGFLVLGLVVGCADKKDDGRDIRERQDLNIISEDGVYALAIDEETEMMTTYAVFENIRDKEYEKKFKIEYYINPVGYLWKNNYLYILDYNFTRYNLEDGSKSHAGENTNVIFRDDKYGVVEPTHIIGSDDKYIYYDYRYGYYGKITLDLDESELISREDIPKNLN